MQLSPTALNLYRSCPRCFWLARRKGIKRPSGPFPSLPGGMDRLLKVHFDRHRASGSVPPELASFDGRLFPDRERLDAWRSARRGLRCTLGDATLMGALDDLFVTADTMYAPLDFKTRGSPHKEVHDAYQLQMDTYALLLDRNDLPSAGFAILVFYHPTKVNAEHVIEFHAEPVRVATSPERAQRLCAMACRVLEGDEPPPSSDCVFCKWGDALHSADQVGARDHSSK